MVVRGKIVNRPSDGRERWVSSAVLILDGPDRRERIAGAEPAAVIGEKDGNEMAGAGRRFATRRGPDARISVILSLYDPASTGGWLDAVDRGLFGGRGLPPGLRILLRDVRASGWTQGARYPARSTRPG